MKNLKLNAQGATELTKDQMKNIKGGIKLPCYRCCPTDKCSSKPHACPEVNCGEI